MARTNAPNPSPEEQQQRDDDIEELANWMVIGKMLGTLMPYARQMSERLENSENITWLNFDSSGILKPGEMKSLNDFVKIYALDAKCFGFYFSRIDIN